MLQLKRSLAACSLMMFVGGGLLGAGALLASSTSMSMTTMTMMMMQQQVDYSRLPARPAEVAERISGMDVSLVDAIRRAEEAAGGGRASAAGLVHNAPAPSYIVDVYAEGEQRRFEINASTGEITRQETVPWLPGAPVEGEWTETASGLRYFDIVVGDGPSPADASSRVRVHYSGWLVDGAMSTVRLSAASRRRSRSTA